MMPKSLEHQDMKHVFRSGELFSGVLNCPLDQGMALSKTALFNVRGTLLKESRMSLKANIIY